MDPTGSPSARPDASTPEPATEPIPSGEAPGLRPREPLTAKGVRRSPVVVGTVDRDLRYTWVFNPRPHFPVEEALGRRDDEIAPPSVGLDRLMALKRDVLATGVARDETIDFELGDAMRTYEIAATPVFDTTGEVSGVTTVSVDVSELQGLVRSQQELMAMVAHDLRNPVSIVRSRAQLMLRRSEFDAEALRDIVQQSDRMARMTEDLLDTAVIVGGSVALQREQVDLADLARGVLAHFAAFTDLHTLDFAVVGPVVGEWDRARVEQVLENLVGNAVKYSPGGGAVRVDIQGSDEDVQVSVSDQGLGIDAQDLPKVFDCFGRAQAVRNAGLPGLGLGLCICKGLVEAHGGRISAVSEGTGRGSTFSFSLPRREPLVGPLLNAGTDAAG